MRIKSVVVAFALILGFSVQYLQALRAQSEVLVSLYQGEEIKLPEDFVARLDGNSLKVALKSFGLARPNVDRDVMVSLIRENGQRTNIKPDANGEITFNDVKEGLAALVVAGGPLSYAAIPFYAAPGKARGNDAAAVDVVPAAFEVPVGSVDSSMIRTSVQNAGQAPAGPSARALTDYTTRAVNRFQVRLTPRGDLNGRVIVPEAGYDVRPGIFTLSFYRNGGIVGQSTSTPEGLFVVSGLTPGIHTVFATGPAGHSAFAFEIVGAMGEDLPGRLSKNRNNKSKFVSTETQDQLPIAANVINVVPADELIVLVIPPRLMPEVRNIIQEFYPLPSDVVALGPDAPFAAPGIGAPGGFSGGGLGGGGGGFGGGSAGGGGGFGGGGGGALLGAAGLAAGIAAASSNNDSFNAPPATPIVPRSF